MSNRVMSVSYFLVLIFLSATSGCSTYPTASPVGFAYKDFPVAKETAQAGEGSSIQFQGKSLHLTGPGIREGDTLRSTQIARGDLSLVDIADSKGKIRIISIVPSLDTKVCEQQTHYLSERNQGLDQQVSLVTISVDTPFAQTRFAKEAHIANVTFLSDYRGGEFGKSHGLLLKGPHLLARAVMVVDKDNVIQYLQVTPELGQFPDMEAAFRAARILLGSA